MKIGIDIGGSHIATGIILEKGKLLAKETRDISISDIYDEKRVEKIILDTIQIEIKTLLEANDYTNADITKIGIAIPGAPKDGVIKTSVNLHIKKFNIASELGKIYKTRVRIKNDGKCAGLAEKKYGNLSKYDDCVFLCIGTGVGSAVFLNGELLEPNKNPGFEFGHIIINKDGNQCNCGSKGCFETYASMKRFKENAIKKLKLPKDCQAEELQQYIRENKDKEDVAKFVDEFLENVSIGLSNIINIFEPEAICFGGSFSYYQDIFLPIIKEKVNKYVLNKEEKIQFIAAKLRNDAGMIGASEI